MRFFARSSSKSPISRARVVDAIALSPDESAYALSMIETRPWTGGDQQLRQVQEKLSAYLDYIESGELEEAYPDAREKKKVIILHCAEEPTEDAREFLRLAGDYVRERGFSFEVWPERADAP